MRHSKSDPPPRPRRRRLPGPLRWLLKIISIALVISLVLVFLPRLTRLVGRLWPDPARTARVSEILRHELSDSAKLETTTVDDQGVLTATVNAALIGEVQRVTIEYDYHASVGVDLEKTDLAVQDGVMVLTLPDLEIISDSLDPIRVDRQDFWYPLTEKRRTQLLAQEKAERAEAALRDSRTEENRTRIRETLSRLIDSWLGTDTWLTTVEIRFAQTP